MALDSGYELARHTMPDADGAILTAAQYESLVEAAEGWPQNVISLFVTAIFAAILAGR